MKEKRDENPGCLVLSPGGVDRSGLRGQETKAAAYIENKFWDTEPT